MALLSRSLSAALLALLLTVDAGRLAAQEPEDPSPPAPGAEAPAPAEPPVEGQISARVVPVGSQAVLSYRIAGSVGEILEEYPREIVVQGLNVSFRQVMRRVMNVNGQIITMTELHYRVEPEEPGEYTIPPQTLRAGGRVLTTAAVSFVAEEGPPVNDDMQPVAQLSLGKTEVWKGEVVPVEVALLLHPSVQPVSQFFPQIRTDNFAVTRFDRAPAFDTREFNGEFWRVWRMESVMTPLKAGQQTFGPAEVKAEVLMPLPNGSGYRDPFGRLPSTRKTLKIESNAVSINVKELPKAGRPPDFDGPVGIFQLEVTAQPTELKIGESVIVEMQISGTGNFDAAQAPALENTDGWRVYKARVSEENRGWGTEPGRKSFTQILTAEKNLTELPPLVFHFFDPASGQYVTRKSDPIPLKITGDARDLAAAGAGTGGQDFSLLSDAAIPVEELNDILPNAIGGGKWISAAVAPAPVNPWLLHGAPAALLALILGAGAARRWRHYAATRKPKENEPRPLSTILKALALTRLTRREFYTLVNEYLNAWTWHRGRPLPDGPSAPPELREILAARDRWLYGSTAEEASAPMPAEEQKAVRQTLARL